MKKMFQKLSDLQNFEDSQKAARIPLVCLRGGILERIKNVQKQDGGRGKLISIEKIIHKISL